MKIFSERRPPAQTRRAAAWPEPQYVPPAGVGASAHARGTAQRERIDSAFGAPMQRLGEEDELQMKAAGTLQRQEDEEEMLQGRFDPAQRLEDEEDPLQARADAGLEREADVMGARASHMRDDEPAPLCSTPTRVDALSDSDARETSPTESLQRMSGVIQMGGGGYYWRRRATPNAPNSPWGPWTFCGKYGSHGPANEAMKKNGWTTGNGWEFKQGGKNNPPGQ